MRKRRDQEEHLLLHQQLGPADVHLSFLGEYNRVLPEHSHSHTVAAGTEVALGCVEH